ncbi:MAG: hypothetical protein IKR23_07940 [Lachnospiraceae bacterium]|nr:hypothetical protein [Lachnospiraceae bacterium]
MLRGITNTIIILILAPFLCSELIRRKESSALENYVFGLAAVWALFEVISVPFIIASAPFSVLSTVYSVVLALLVLAGSVKLTLRRKKEISDKKDFDLRSLLPWIPVILLLLAQCVFFVMFQHYDGDDSYYVAQSTITLKFDTMFRRDVNNGFYIEVEGRHALGALPIWISWLSDMSGLHPAIIDHSIMAPYLLTVMYAVYAMFSGRIIKDKKWRPVFVLLIGLWYIHSNVSLYTAETFAYTRTWQGKAVFANIIVPLAFCLVADIYSRTKNTLPLCLMLSLCAVFCTSTAVYMLIILYGCAGLVLGCAAFIKTKKLKNALLTLVPFIIASLPLVAGGVIYLIIRR